MGNQTGNSQEPILSTIIAMVSDTSDGRYDLALLERCLQALSQQVDPPPMELLVPYPAKIQGIERLVSQYPLVKFIAVGDLKSYTSRGGSREHHDELRARGLLAAKGQILALVEDHSYPDTYWCKRMVEAHQNCFAAVGGAIENSVDRTLNWAVFFSDSGKYQNPLPAIESRIASEANVSYKRAALESIRSTWQSSFHETEVNGELRTLGEKLTLSPEAIIFQNRKNLSFSKTMKEHYIWGRSYAAIRSHVIRTKLRIIYAILSPLLPIILITRVTLTVINKNRLVDKFFLALPIIILLTISWSLGEFLGYVTLKPAGG